TRYDLELEGDLSILHESSSSTRIEDFPPIDVGDNNVEDKQDGGISSSRSSCSKTIFLETLDLDFGSRNPRPLEERVRARKSHSDQDGHGHIYVYTHVNDDEDWMYYKIGETSQSVRKRLQQWHGAQKVKSWECKRRKLAECLIHAYFEHCRMYRFLVNEKYVSVWWTLGKFVADAHYCLCQPVTISELKNQKFPRHTEWFQGPFDRLRDPQRDSKKVEYFDDIVSYIVRWVNAQYVHEEWDLKYDRIINGI
ncbi:MAG: GIY-YIG nuclease family protein, partial [Promethearchaeota archaeon]